MAHLAKFDRELDSLLKKRTEWLRYRIFKGKRGRPFVFNKKDREESIQRLQEIATKSLVRNFGSKKFKENIEGQKHRKIKGRGVDGKKELFRLWFDKEFSSKDYLIYVFWGNNKRCIYVGRTGLGGDRPSAHFDKIWIRECKRIQIFPVNSISNLAKTECLAIHQFNPKENRKRKADRTEYSKKCFICQTEKEIKEEVTKIFNIR